MMRNRGGWSLWALAGLWLTAGCSDTVTGGGYMFADALQDTNPYQFGDADAGKDAAAETQDDGSVAQDVDPTAKGQLQYAIVNDDFGGKCETACALLVNQNGLRPLPVKYLKGGVPVEGAIVEFSLADPQTTLGDLQANNVPTDGDGKASADIKVGPAQGTFTVVAKVPDDPEAGALEFEIHVASKAKGPFSVTLHYAGAKFISEFGVVKVRLTTQKAGEPACKSIDLGGALPTAAWESPPALKWDKPWSPTYTNFPTWVQQQGGEVKFTVIGIAALKSGSPPLAGGCIDTGATVTWNAVTKTLEGDSVYIDVSDIPPRLAGTYDLHTFINLVSILPDPVENVITAILDIVQDPVAGLLSLVCKLGGSSLDSLCKNIFDDPKNPSINNLAQPFGGIIVKFLDGILLSFLPDSVKTGLNAGGDVAEILQNMEMVGTIELKQEPDNTGFLAKEFTREEWTKVIYKWTLGKACDPKDEACGKDELNLGAFGNGGNIVGQFDLWRDGLKSEIKIGLHGLTIKWGALVNHLLKNVVLPTLTNDPKYPTVKIDTYEELIKSLLAGKACLIKDTCCEEFAASIYKKTTLLPQSTLTGACEMMITVGVKFLEDQLISLDVESGDPSKNSGLLLATDKCAIFEVNDDQQVDSLGMKTSPCTWDMTVTIGGNPTAIKSTFYATLQQ